MVEVLGGLCASCLNICLKRLSFQHRIAFAYLSNTSWPYLCGAITVLSVPFICVTSFS